MGGVLRNVNRRDVVYCVFCHLSNAFDILDHELVNIKLYNYRIKVIALAFFLLLTWMVKYCIRSRRQWCSKVPLLENGK